MAESNLRKLPFHVVYATSEEEGHPASELNHHGPSTRGWVSSNFCEYPQEIGIQFDEGSVNVAQIQLLSHQYLIATKIELFAGMGSSYDTARFKRLGYLSLDNNQRSGYRARELKSVYVDAAGTYLKFRVHRCYLNNQNHTNQVSIVAISVLGTPGGVAPVHLKAAPAPKHGRGARAHGAADLAVDVGMDPETASKLREVARLKNEAVASEDYEAAKQYKEVETRIRAAASQLARLHSEKQAAVASEDYDLAKRLKDEIMRVRRAVMGVGEAPPPAMRSPPRHGSGRGFDHHGPPPGSHHGGAGPMEHAMSPHHSRGGSFGRGPGGPGSPGRLDGPGGGGGVGAPGGGGGGFPGDAAYGGGFPGDAAYGGGGPGSAPVSPQRSQYGGGAGGPGEGGGFPGDAAYADRGAAPMNDMGAPPMHGNAPTGHGMADEMERPLPGNRSRNIYEDAAETHGMTPGRPQSRAIKPAGADTAARAMDNDDAVAGFGGGAPGAASVRPTGQGDPSQLAGVEGADTFPAPTPMSDSKLGEVSELVAVFGEYVVRCFFSKKPWTLRDAALQKVQLELKNYQNPPSQVAKAVLTLLHLAATKDKIAQVFLTSINLVKPVLALCSGSGVRQGEFLGMLEPLAGALVDKLGDNNARCREATFTCLLNLAHEDLVGAPFVSNMVMRKLKKKQAAAWRPLLTRLQLLLNILELLGLGRRSGITADNLCRFLVDTNACAHSNGDVRDAARDLCVEIHKTEGDGILSRLGHLRKKQLEEYKAAFAGAGAGGGPGPGAGAGAGTGGGRGRRGGRGGGRGGGRLGGGGRGGGRGGRQQRDAPPRGGPQERKSSGARDAPEEPEVSKGDEEEDEEETECQFCGWQFPPDLSDSDLDMHYWQDCPMLTQCPACQQVIEISTLHDHLLVECEHQAKFRRCERCGEVIAASEFKAHTDAGKCTPAVPPDVANRCPLCHKDVEPGPDGWLTHLLDNGCPSNPRKRVS